MRRPRFYRWIKLRILEAAHADTFNMRMLAAQAQTMASPTLTASLMLYAHENECFERLMSFVYDEGLLKEFRAVKQRLGWRSIEQLALRGTPMMSLPEHYRSILAAFERAYHKPERIAAEKKTLGEQARAAILRSGIAPAKIAADLGLDAPNLNAFVMRGETHRFNMETARRIVAYASQPYRTPTPSSNARDLSCSQELTVSPAGGAIRLIGRTCCVDGVTWLAHSGSAIEFEAVGTRVAIEMAGGDAVENVSDLCPRFAVFVDGEVVLDDTLCERSRSIEVFKAESATRAVIRVMQLSEAKRGVVGVKAVTVESDAVNPIVPTTAKNLSIEFIGDSITCGYAVESTNVDDPFKTTMENFMKSYAYLAANALNADYSAVCYSGYGIVSGASIDGRRVADMLVPPLYDLVSQDFDKPWGFAAHPHDVVVINLGTNDFCFTGTNRDRMREFALGYARFLTQVRKRNPSSLIICTLGTMGCQELFPSIEKAVERFMNRTGDTRITCYLSDPIDVATEGIGTKGHPTWITQQKSANTLVDAIRQLLGKDGVQIP